MTVWLLYLVIGQATGIAHPHVHGHFATKAECEWIGKSVARDLRRHGKSVEMYCGAYSEPEHGK